MERLVSSTEPGSLQKPLDRGEGSAAQPFMPRCREGIGCSGRAGQQSLLSRLLTAHVSRPDGRVMM